MTPFAETSAGPIGPILIAVSLLTMAYVFRRALATRAVAMRAMNGPLAAGTINDAERDSAAEIEDGGVVPSKVLLGSMCRRAQTDDDFDEEDEGVGDMLGLTYHRWKNLSSDWVEPALYDGTRGGRQVWIRLGRSGTSLRGAGFNDRRMRTTLAVRAAVAPFEVVSEAGRLRVVSGDSADLGTLLAGLSCSPDVWRDVRIVGGAEGIVASRGSAQDFVGGWIYDLWLLERLAARLGGRALEQVELGREWTPPYGLGSWAPSLRGELAGLAS